MPPQLICDNPRWLYWGYGVVLTHRHLRVWQTEPQHITAIITESGAGGTSVTNAIEMIAAQLAAEYPGHIIELIEHQLPRPTLDWPEEFQRVTFDARGRPSWHNLSMFDLVERFGLGLLGA